MPRAIRAGSYRAVLSLPFALRTFAPALGGRLAYGLLPLATLFTVIDATGSYATAGLALALFGITTFAAPAKSRLADRLGQRRTLPALAVLCAAALIGAAFVGAAFVGAATTRSSAGLVVLIGLAGLAAPPLGPAMRATWRVLTLGTTLKERAYALDSVAEESLYLAGPLLAGLMIAAGRASGALLVVAFLLVTGTIGMVLPPPAGHRSPPAARVRGRAVVPELRPVLVVLLVSAAGVSVAYTAAAAAAVGRGHPGAAGWLEAAAAVGGVTGGLLWARLTRKPRMTGLLAGQAVSALLAAAVTGRLPLLGVALLLGGAAVAPLYVVAYLAADDLAPEGRGTEAGTWVNVAANAGSAGGSALAGFLVQSAGPARAFLAAGVVLALISGMSALRPRSRS